LEGSKHGLRYYPRIFLEGLSRIMEIFMIAAEPLLSRVQI
jgi:hypothetical protein